MRRLIFILLVMGLFITPALAEEPNWIPDPTGCFRYWLNDKDVLVVDVIEQLTVDKESVATSSKDVEKLCNERGKSLYGQLLKLDFVSNVIIGPRQVAIRVYSFPAKPWEKGLGQALGVFTKVVCK